MTLNVDHNLSKLNSHIIIIIIIVLFFFIIIIFIIINYNY